MVLPRLKELNGSMLDAAADLGATQSQTLRDVIIPFITPGIFAGFFMALTYSLDDFAVTFFVTGNGFSTLSVEIYSRARQGISLEINALSGLLFVLTLVLIVGYYIVSQSSQRRLLRKKSEVLTVEKKLLAVIISLLAICGLLAFSANRLIASDSGGSNGNKVLNLYNWGDYIDPNLIQKFQQQTGYHVNIETFDSNEAMFTKIKQGGTSYDLTVPSDYMIEKMRAAHLLLPLDKSRLSGLSNNDPRLMNLAFDPHNRYSIPYFWGTLGIIYNDQIVKPGSLKHWQQLWSPKYRNQIMLVDSARDILGFALASNGDSMNTTNLHQLTDAKNKLNQLSPNVKAIVLMRLKCIWPKTRLVLPLIGQEKRVKWWPTIRIYTTWSLLRAVICGLITWSFPKRRSTLTPSTRF